MLRNCDSHWFHLSCVKGMMAGKEWLKCPVCMKMYGVVTGDQPDGRMTHRVHPVGDCAIEGFELCATIEMRFSFHDGIQTADHKDPGKPYTGTQRTAFLPDNDEGRDIFRMMRIAWERRLLFTIGDSLTSGRTNTVTWNGIHMKTHRSGGTDRHGYPDETYFKSAIPA